MNNSTKRQKLPLKESLVKLDNEIKEFKKTSHQTCEIIEEMDDKILAIMKNLSVLELADMKFVHDEKSVLSNRVEDISMEPD